MAGVSETRDDGDRIAGPVANVTRLLPSGNEAGSPPGDRAFRPDVEGLRAVAILLVVLYHAGLTRLSGGFVGVDVFFVVSGYVITGVLLRERVVTGRTSLLGFYARRCRRILPAATVVILVTVALSYGFLGVLGGNSAAIDGRWAAVFLANFHFANTGANYFDASRLPSPLQNYWSLSVEEQFYVVYPTLFLIVTRFKGTISRESRLALLLGIVVVGSFVLSVSQTSSDPVLAYYSPFTRAWELALGALVAVGARWLVRLPKNLAAVFSWVGLFGVLTAAFVFNAQTPYPGWAVALPVLSTALIIAAGTAAPTLGVERALGLRPFLWLGGLSYSLYLWHWPILILAAESSGKASLPFSQNLWWLLIALLASLISSRLIENPIRRSRFLVDHRTVSVGIGIALVVAAVVTLTLQINGASGPSLSGEANAGSIATPQELNQLILSAPHTMALPVEMIPSSLSDVVYDVATRASCWPSYGQSSEPLCVLGDPHGTRTIALYGDSHAGMWSADIDEIAEAAHWKLVLLGKGSCPANILPVPNPSGWGALGGEFTACDQWHKWALGEIQQLQPNVLIISQEVYTAPNGVGYSPLQWKHALEGMLQSVKSRSPKTKDIVLGNIPHQRQSGPECLSRNPDNVQACSGRPLPFYNAYNNAEQNAVTTTGGRYIDTAPWFCGRTCTPIVGNYEVYYDEGHVTATYAHFLTDLLAKALGMPSVRSPVPDPYTVLITPSDGTTLSGRQLIDIRATDPVMVRKVEAQLKGPTVSETVLGYAAPTLYGWLLYWNTANVPNGTYELRSVVYDIRKKVAYSKPIAVTVKNP
jgi:peptidoglycan/LPS O-acetylase OafA/YrhL